MAYNVPEQELRREASGFAAPGTGGSRAGLAPDGIGKCMVKSLLKFCFFKLAGGRSGGHGKAGLGEGAKEYLGVWQGLATV